VRNIKTPWQEGFYNILKSYYGYAIGYGLFQKKAMCLGNFSFRRRLRGKLLRFKSEISEWRKKSEIIKQSAQRFLDYEGWLNAWEELYKIVAYRKCT